MRIGGAMTDLTQDVLLEPAASNVRQEHVRIDALATGDRDWQAHRVLCVWARQAIS